LAQEKVFSIERFKLACRECSLSGVCLPVGLARGDVDRLDSIVKRNRPFHRNDFLFRAGDEFSTLYVVKTGTVKTFIHNPDGSELVLGFHLPGEIVGLDGIDEDRHGCFAQALETTAVCELPFENLERLSTEISGLQHQLLRLMSREITKETNLMKLLGNSSAEERLAAFLISLSCRLIARGYSGDSLNLSMSRQEIGSYLGLALETISRLFTSFHERGILRVNRKHVEIIDQQALRALVGIRMACPSQAQAPIA
jgi:CRP/FNR family transcriptional regulator